MKLFKASVLLLCALNWAQTAWAQSWRTERYDTRWLPISKTELQKQVRANTRDAVALYRLWDRARYQQLQPEYFAALKRLKNQQPDNGVVLATYCAVLMNSNTLYGFVQHKFPTEKGESDAYTIGLNIERAKKLEPKLWIVYTTEAYVKFSRWVIHPKRHRERLNPVAKPSNWLPNCPTRIECWVNFQVSLAFEKKANYTQVANSYQKAKTLLPVDSDTGFLLRNVYRYYTPNKARASQIDQQIVATIPPAARRLPRTVAILKKQGILVPKS